MSRTINFLQDRRRVVTQQQVQDKKYLTISGYFLASVVTVFVVVLVTQLSLRYFFNQLKAEQDRLEQSIAANEEVEESVLIASQKLKILALLFAKRNDKQEAIKYFTNAFGSNVTLGEINYEAGSSILSLSLKADTVFDLEQIFTLVESQQITELFGQVSKSELRRTDDGTYAVTLTLSLEGVTGSPGGEQESDS